MSNKYNGLLKILGSRLSETRKTQEENEKLREEIQSFKIALNKKEGDITLLIKKIKEIRARQRTKVTEHSSVFILLLIIILRNM